MERKVWVEGLENHRGRGEKGGRRGAGPGEKPNPTSAKPIPATKVPCPSLALLEKPKPSPTKSSPPITEPSNEMCGKPGRMPLSISATITPAPVVPPARRGLTFMIELLIR